MPDRLMFYEFLDVYLMYVFDHASIAIIQSIYHHVAKFGLTDISSENS